MNPYKNLKLFVLVVIVGMLLAGCAVGGNPNPTAPHATATPTTEATKAPSTCTTCATPPAAPAPEATPVPALDTNPPTPAVTEPVQLRDMQDVVNYPLKVKYRLGDEFYCAAVARGAAMPAGFVHIEEWKAEPGDGDYLHSAGQYGMAAFCSDTPEKHGAKHGQPWITGLLELDGFHEAKFPLAK